MDSKIESESAKAALNSAKTEASNVALRFKMICFRRCLNAIGLSICVQFLLLAVFLFFVNIDVLHPVQWFKGTLTLVFSFYTWFCIIPLIVAVIANGVVLSKMLLAPRKYYKSRFNRLLGTGLVKSTLFVVQLLLGLVTAWVYSRFLHMDYSRLFYPCFGSQCLNGRCTFLIFVGISVACYHFVQEHLRQDAEVEFPIIQMSTFVKCRTLLYGTIYTSLSRSIAPTCFCALSYFVLGTIVNRRLATLFVVELDEGTSLSALATHGKLLFYAWILATQILNNLHLMQQLMSLFLSDEVPFNIAGDLRLVDALAFRRLPVIQNLAAWYLLKISLKQVKAQRQPLFVLTSPGGHPENWNRLCSLCLRIINEFTDQLYASVLVVSPIKTPEPFATITPSASDTAAKILMRQYNTMYGIRRMVPESPPNQMDAVPPMPNTVVGKQAQRMSDACQRLNARIEKFSQQINEALRTAFCTIPGLLYTFCEPGGAKTAYLILHSQMIIWITQALAGICVASLTEDKYGVVQEQLPQIIKALLRLRKELNKLVNMNLNGRKSDRNLIALKSALKRSLYAICTNFSDYLCDLVDDPLERHTLHLFATYQET